jgi:hypothetical protein
MKADSTTMKTQYAAKSDLPVAPEPELAPPGEPPHVAVAPGLLDKEHVVIRSDDDTDEDYQARCDMLVAVLAFAKQQG